MTRSRAGYCPGGPEADREALRSYQAFMAGYVRRINEATLNVAIGGVRIGSAKHSRLAQINLKTRIITFSRYAVENVPERGRRYLVLHELSHVIEASHNKRFWSIVGRYEPEYRQIGRSLDEAFRRNVRADRQAAGALLLPGAAGSGLPLPAFAGSPAGSGRPGQQRLIITPDNELVDEGDYMCQDDEPERDGEFYDGIIHGGFGPYGLEHE